MAKANGPLLRGTRSCAKELFKLTKQKQHYGYRQLHSLLGRRDQALNMKRVRRTAISLAYRCRGLIREIRFSHLPIAPTSISSDKGRNEI